MKFSTIIFDFDGVLSAYHLPDRLGEMSRMTGLDTATIQDRIWTSGLEDAADSGRYTDDIAYLDAFSARLGYRFSRDDWIASRAVAMRHRPDMHDLAGRLSRHYKLALLTNNGPLAKITFGQLAPETAELFGDRAFFFPVISARKNRTKKSSCRWRTGLPACRRSAFSSTTSNVIAMARPQPA